MKLNRQDKGREGLFGNTMDPDAYEKKTSLAAAISQKESTRDPVFDQTADYDRKTRELYGNSNYNPIGKEKNRQFKPAHTGMDAELDRNTRGKKAGFLASNILGNDDPNIVAERA